MLRQPLNIILAVIAVGLIAVVGVAVAGGAIFDSDSGDSGAAAQAELQPEQRVLFSDLGMT
jgi:hypothetical protein